MDMEIARDIESCLGCPHLVFPGDEVIVSAEGLTHAEHQQTTRPFSGAELAGV